MSSPLPCGMPSAMSTNTTSASSLCAMLTAQLAPTLPAPTTVTLLRIELLGSFVAERNPSIYWLDPMTALEHLMILDLTRLLPGAVATQMMAAFGARVIKIEQPG